jgi:hypothetical protein
MIKREKEVKDRFAYMRGGELKNSRRRQSIWTDKLKKQKIGMNEDNDLDLDVSNVMSEKNESSSNHDISTFKENQSQTHLSPGKDLILETNPSNDFSVSRFTQDFDQITALGQGGFGAVFKARNKLDGNWYAVKRMVLDYSYPDEVKKLLSEVKLLSQFSHPHIVRYYQAWKESIPLDELELILEGDSEESSYYLEEEELDHDPF